MRDLILFGIVFWGLIKVFAQAHVGVYLWTWISLMNPHRLSWGAAFTFPFAQVIAITTLIGLMTSRQPRLRIWHPETVVLAMLILWVSLTTFLFAVNPEGAYKEFDRFIKIQVFIFLTILLVSDKKKLDGFLWVMVLSMGFYGVKGGIFTILTAGHSRVWGPPETFIDGNNEMALALLMTVPLLRYLHLQETRKWLRHGLGVAMFLCMVSIVGSQSRGALVGIVAMGFFLWLKSRHKLGTGVMVALAALTILFMMPQSWWDRMNTINTYEQDNSAMGRINAWWVALNVANATFVGGGANVFTAETFRRYAPVPEDVHDVHSIYFEMLGEQGYVGLALFLLLGWLFWRRCARMIRRYQDDPERKWVADLGAMLQVGFIAYAVSGAFLGLAYFDYYYDMIAVALIAWQVAEREAVPGAAAVPGPGGTGAGKPAPRRGLARRPPPGPGTTAAPG